MYIQVQYPSGRCYAAQSENPAKPDWPPHPSRLYSAIVSSAYQSNDGMNADKQAALEYLEALPAPSISSPGADLSPAPTVYVPPGDIKGKKGKEYEHGVFRWRQPRHFPSAFIHNDPTVIYQWEEDPDNTMLTLLNDIAAGVTHVGTSHSMALVSVFRGKYNRAMTFTFIPDRNGKRFFRVPSVGRLKELDEIFEGKFGLRRPPAAFESQVGYRNIAKKTHRGIPSKFYFYTLRISGPSYNVETSIHLSRIFRAAIMSVIGDDAPTAVHGHGKGEHIGWFPLPDVDHENAKGNILGIGIAIPRSISASDRKKIFTGIKNLKTLVFQDGRVAEVTPIEPGKHIPIALNVDTWTASSRTWATTTPVVLDRPPKKLTEDRIKTAMAQSIQFAGFPTPEKIEVSPFSWFRGSPPAFHVPLKKPRYHAFVHFEEPIVGPVMAGRLRFFGIGVFRPYNEEQKEGGI